ncbi:MAG: prolipoprotein diacylglyceryl transferase, partial [Oscillospiraceae bacterium]
MSDYTVVYFAGIEKGFSVPAVLAKFTIFGMELEIRWYGILIAIGFIIALIVATKLAKKGNMNIDKLYDAVIYGTIFAIIGARLYYVAFEWDYYSQHLGDILKIYEGGLAIYGGLIAAVLAAIVVCKINKTSILKTLDVASVGFL